MHTVSPRGDEVPCAIVLFFKLTGLFFRVCGKLLGIVFSLIGYALIGALVIAALGVAVNVIPLLLLVGVGATAIAAVKN